MVSNHCNFIVKNENTSCIIDLEIDADVSLAFIFYKKSINF